MDKTKLFEKVMSDNEGGPSEEYVLDPALQGEILNLLATDNHFHISSRGLVKPAYFTQEVHKLFAKKLFGYFEQYRNLPAKRILLQEIEEDVAGKDAPIRAHYRSEASAVYDDLVPGLDSRDYYLDKITTFAKVQTMREAFLLCNKMLKENASDPATWMKVYEVLRQAMTVDRNFDMGLDYFQTYEERYEKIKQEAELGEIFHTGFKQIDDCLLGGGLRRGEIGAWVGLPGTGKSIALVVASIINAIKGGKKVLYVSTEMDQDGIAGRFDSQITAASFILSQAGHPLTPDDVIKPGFYNNLLKHKSRVFSELEKITKDFDNQQMLIIKQFAGGTADVNMIRAYYNQCELHGFKADLVIVDYIGEMKDAPNMPTWESRYRMVRDLRGFAVECKICVLTAMQPDRKAREETKLGGMIDDNNLADSFGQARPLDALWSINRTQTEEEANIGTVFIIKHRNGKSRIRCRFHFDNDTLIMRQIGEDEYNLRLAEAQNNKTETASQVTEGQKPPKRKGNPKINENAGKALGLDSKGNIDYSDDVGNQTDDGPELPPTDDFPEDQ